MHLYRALIPFVTLALALVANSSPVGYHSRASDTYARDVISYAADSGSTHNIRDVYPSTHFSEARSSSAGTDLFVRESPPPDYVDEAPPPYESPPNHPVGEHGPAPHDAKLPIGTKAPAKEDEKAPATPATPVKEDEKAPATPATPAKAANRPPLSPMPKPLAPSGNKPKGVFDRLKAKWNQHDDKEKMGILTKVIGGTSLAAGVTAMGLQLYYGRCKRGELVSGACNKSNDA
ncbi:hypothetical protein DFJ43DRAFT_679567 [Lentinula guzmanii]|uniref:Uncharacterized protein n=1 Tax=Lentinula guzmanii TaxID=2804957 RepID=A0AA38JJR8_9AGAR|nr:hypothetical protein DFJ43DRAFT_679567 [Lentinula guzmanii]